MKRLRRMLAALYVIRTITSGVVVVSGFYPYTWWAQLAPSEK